MLQGRLGTRARSNQMATAPRVTNRFLAWESNGVTLSCLRFGRPKRTKSRFSRRRIGEPGYIKARGYNVSRLSRLSRLSRFKNNDFQFWRRRISKVEGFRRMKTGGRRRGTSNKTTASVKAAMMAAFDGAGGLASLVDFAKADPATFYQLWAKMLPM